MNKQSHIWFGISDLETQIRILADIGDGEKSDFNFIDIKRLIPLENTLIIRAQIAYYIDSEDTLIDLEIWNNFIGTGTAQDVKVNVKSARRLHENEWNNHIKMILEIQRQ